MSRLLIAARHGVTDWNAEERFQGRVDIPLNLLGIQQSRSLKQALSSFRFDGIYSSPLLRARQTAVIVAGQQAVCVDPRLAEIDVGVWQGLTKNQIASRWLSEWSLWRNDPASYTPDGGESFSQLERRLHDFVKDVDGDRVLCITHGKVIQALRIILAAGAGRADDMSVPDNATFTVFNL